MSLIRLLPARFHAVADYAVAALLILVPLIVKGSTLAVATGVVAGIVIAVVSALNRYPLGVVKVLPFTVHSVGDYLAVVLLIAAPFALHFDHTDPGLSQFYAAAGLAVLAVSVITNYQYSPKRAGTPAKQTVPVQQATPAHLAALALGRPGVPASPGAGRPGPPSCCGDSAQPGVPGFAGASASPSCLAGPVWLRITW